MKFGIEAQILIMMQEHLLRENKRLFAWSGKLNALSSDPLGLPSIYCCLCLTSSKCKTYKGGPYVNYFPDNGL